MFKKVENGDFKGTIEKSTEIDKQGREVDERLMGKKVSIIVLNYRNWQDTVECLASLFDISYQPYRVIVVDNDSQNGSLQQIEEWLSVRDIVPLRLTQEQSEKGDFDDNHVVLIQASSNRGYSSGNNIGLRWAMRAKDEYALILNNDTVVDKHFLEPLVDFLDARLDAAAVGPRITDSDGNLDVNCARKRPTTAGYLFRFGIINILFPRNRWALEHYYFGEYGFDDPKEVDILSGSCLLIRLEIIRKMNYLDEGTFLFLEEFILSENIRSFGKKSFCIPTSRITHKKGSSVKSKPSLFVFKKGIESCRYYLTKYRGVPFLMATILMYPFYLRYGIKKLRNMLNNKSLKS